MDFGRVPYTNSAGGDLIAGTGGPQAEVEGHGWAATVGIPPALQGGGGGNR